MSTHELRDKAIALIPPWGTNLLSKAYQQYGTNWPTFYSRAAGVYIWDLNFDRYLDFSTNGVGACVLGYCDPVVNRAVTDAISRGNLTSLNCPEDVELAELLCDLHPWAEQVRYARTGGEACAMAVRIARAATGCHGLAVCSYSGWTDFYLSANLRAGALDDLLLPGLEPAGVPDALRGLTRTFRYNDIASLEALLDDPPRGDGWQGYGAIIIEPVRSVQPKHGFLEAVREIAMRIGAVLIFDEISSGFRLTCGGAHKVYGVEPDMAVFAKAMSNGYPMAAVIGRRSVMEACAKTFISSTYHTDRIGPSATLATIRRFRHLKAHEHLINVGQMVQDVWRMRAEQAGLNVEISGIPPLSHLRFDYPNGQAVMTLFTQLMLEREILAAGNFYPTLAHVGMHIGIYDEALAEVFDLLADAIEQGTVEKQLKGPVAVAGFGRLT